MRNWLIRLLGGLPREEAEFLRVQISGADKILEQTLEIGRVLGEIKMSLSSPSESPLARPQPDNFGKQPIKTASEPWTLRRRRLEAEDLRRMRDEGQKSDYEGGSGRDGSSEAAFR